jgi:hypothetical protein
LYVGKGEVACTLRKLDQDPFACGGTAEASLPLLMVRVGIIVDESKLNYLKLAGEV